MVMDDQGHLEQLVDEAKRVTELRVANDELLAAEAWDWIVERFNELVTETNRKLAVEWLQSGLPLKTFCRRREMGPAEFWRRYLSLCRAIAQRLNAREVRVSVATHGPELLVGLDQIAGYLHRTVDNTQKWIDDGRVAVAEHDGMIIAYGPFIRHARAHRKHANA
jgi:hypothetical protein